MTRITETEILSFLVEDVSALSSAIGRVGHMIARREGQTYARWQILSAASAGDKTVSQLARRLGLTRQSVQRLADLLADDGLVKYKKNPSHKRSPLVGLTGEGTRMLKRLTTRSRCFRELVAKRTTKHGLADLREATRKLFEVVRRAERHKDIVK